MTMTKKRRDEIKSSLAAFVQDGGMYLGFGSDMLADELRELLDGAERLQAIIKWAQDRVHHEKDETDHYYRGVGAACRAILDRVPAAPAPQGEPEG